MPSVTVDVNVELFCGKCGTGICDNGTQRRNRSGALDIDPCAHCLKVAYDEGHSDGYKEGAADERG